MRVAQTWGAHHRLASGNPGWVVVRSGRPRISLVTPCRWTVARFFQLSFLPVGLCGFFSASGQPWELLLSCPIGKAPGKLLNMLRACCCI